MNMNQHIRAWPAVLLGVLNLLVLGAAGGLFPLTAQMLTDFGFESNWRVAVLPFVHWTWTVPMGLILVSGIIMSAHAGQHSRFRRFTVATVALLCSTLVLSLFAIGFVIRGESIAGPFGIGQ